MSDALRAWDERFSQDDYLYGTAPNAFLVRECGHLPARGRVLAVADGEGRNGVWLAQQGFAVHSIDGSPAAVDKARRLAANRDVPVVPSWDDLKPGSLYAEAVDVLEWAWPEDAYDAVVAIFIQFLSPSDRRRVFASMAAALRPSGVLLLEGYGMRQLELRTGGPGAPDLLYDEQLLSTAFPTLDPIDIRTYESVVDEGSLHSGLSALVDLVAIATP